MTRDMQNGLLYLGVLVLIGLALYGAAQTRVPDYGSRDGAPEAVGWAFAIAFLFFAPILLYPPSMLVVVWAWVAWGVWKVAR